MKLLVGLGNPGLKYTNTRHNLGFWIINKLAHQLKVKINKKKFNGLYYKNDNFILLKPQTSMNNSGECILAFAEHFHIPCENILVIYDEIAFSVASFCYRSQGSAGGHNGIKNIIEKLATQNFKRLRVGIDYERHFTLNQWVLGKFFPVEKKAIESILPVLLTSLQEWINGVDFTKIMNKYN